MDEILHPSIVSDFASRPGQLHNAKFCQWHHFHILNGVFEHNCEQCPLTELNIPANNLLQIRIAEGVTLGDLVTSMGSERWALFKDDSAKLKRELLRLNLEKNSAVLHLGGHFPTDLSSNSPYRLVEASQLLVEQLAPRAHAVGFSATQTSSILHRLLEDIGPQEAKTAMTLVSMLGEHFSALEHLTRVQFCLLESSCDSEDKKATTTNLGWKSAEISIMVKDFECIAKIFEKVFYSFSNVVNDCSELFHLRGMRPYLKNQSVDYDVEMHATATSDNDTAIFMMTAIVDAMSFLDTDREHHLGFKQLLANQNPGNPIEAILCAEHLIVDFSMNWLRRLGRDFSHQKRDDAQPRLKKIDEAACKLGQRQASALGLWRGYF